MRSAVNTNTTYLSVAECELNCRHDNCPTPTVLVPNGSGTFRTGSGGLDPQSTDDGAGRPHVEALDLATGNYGELYDAISAYRNVITTSDGGLADASDAISFGSFNDFAYFNVSVDDSTGRDYVQGLLDQLLPTNPSQLGERCNLSTYPQQPCAAGLVCGVSDAQLGGEGKCILHGHPDGPDGPKPQPSQLGERCNLSTHPQQPCAAGLVCGVSGAQLGGEGTCMAKAQVHVAEDNLAAVEGAVTQGSCGAPTVLDR